MHPLHMDAGYYYTCKYCTYQGLNGNVIMSSFLPMKFEIFYTSCCQKCFALTRCSFNSGEIKGELASPNGGPRGKQWLISDRCVDGCLLKNL